MSEGLVTFFKYTNFGFYKRDSEYFEPLDMAEALESLLLWYEDQESLANTLPWDDGTPGYEYRKKVYLKSINRDDATGDYLVTLWRAVGDGRGVYGIRSNTALNEAQVLNAEDAVTGEDIIWGEPAYYWFIPSLNIFASLRFQNSVADTDLMNQYLRNYIELRSHIRQKKVEEKERQNGGSYTSICFPSPQGNLWLRIYSEQFLKLTGQADLRSIAGEITHFVKREVISTERTETESWIRYFRGLPFISNEVTRTERQIEIVVDASPTEQELREIFETYHEQYNTQLNRWENLGFRKAGIGGTFWLNQFIVKSKLVVGQPGGVSRSGYFTPGMLFSAINMRRGVLLAPFATVEPVIDLAFWDAERA
ncbi:MAG: hypothetical protein WA987_00405 [Cellvibrio sp.]